MLLVIACDIVNRMPIPGLLECIASDYADSRSRKYDMQTDICCCVRFWAVTSCTDHEI